MNRNSILVKRKPHPDVETPYGYIYITTNLLDGMKYVGKHVSTIRDESYYGSGKYLLRAIKKHGKENFICEPIDWSETYEELNRKEIQWIAELDAVCSPNWYNLADGGEGHSSEEAKRFVTIETRRKHSENNIGEKNGMYGKGYLIQGEKNGMCGKSHSEGSISKMITTRQQKLVGYGADNHFCGRRHTEEAKQRDRIAHIGKKHTEEWKQNASMENMGKIWVNNNWDEERFIHKEELSGFLSIGWRKGRLGYQNTHKFLFKIKRRSTMKSDLTIKIKYHEDKYGKLVHLGKIPVGDWIDLYSAEDHEFKKDEFYVLSLGVSMQLPKGFEAHLATRSSTFKTWGIIMANSHGIIDESYCGDNDIWKFPALAMRDTVVHKGDKICQFRLVEKMETITFETVEHLNNPDRGGIGSTGTK